MQLYRVVTQSAFGGPPNLSLLLYTQTAADDMVARLARHMPSCKPYRRPATPEEIQELATQDQIEQLEK